MTLDTSALVPSVSLELLVQKRDDMVRRITDAHRLLNEVDDIGENLFGDGDGEYRGYRGHRCALRNYSTHTDFTSDKGLAEAIKEVDGRAWEYLLHCSGLRTLMDATAREQWRKAIEKNDVPDLTLANIHATFSTLHAGRGEMFDRGVLEVFRALSWDFKTNNGVFFGKRIILTYINDDRFGVQYEGCNRIDDLQRVMTVLDGKPEVDHRQGMHRRLHGLRSGEERALDYFNIRVFKKGTGHLTFTRPDLVDKMNAILAKHFPNALPANKEAR